MDVEGKGKGEGRGMLEGRLLLKEGVVEGKGA